MNRPPVGTTPLARVDGEHDIGLTCGLFDPAHVATFGGPLLAFAWAVRRQMEDGGPLLGGHVWTWTEIATEIGCTPKQARTWIGACVSGGYLGLERRSRGNRGRGFCLTVEKTRKRALLRKVASTAAQNGQQSRTAGQQSGATAAQSGPTAALDGQMHHYMEKEEREREVTPPPQETRPGDQTPEANGRPSFSHLASLYDMPGAEQVVMRWTNEPRAWPSVQIMATACEGALREAMRRVLEEARAERASGGRRPAAYWLAERVAEELPLIAERAADVDEYGMDASEREEMRIAIEQARRLAGVTA
jgi:hypothetical protein